MFKCQIQKVILENYQKQILTKKLSEDPPRTNEVIFPLTVIQNVFQELSRVLSSLVHEDGNKISLVF